MSSDILIDGFSATIVQSNSISSCNQVVESHGGESEICGSEKIASLVKLLQEFQCIKECGGYYMSIPLSPSDKWESLFKFARSVTGLELDQSAVQEANQIPSSVFVRLALQLRGGHLFPNISTVKLKNFDVSVHYFPLLISPCLEEISVEFASSGQLEEAAISPPSKGPVHSLELTLSLLLHDLVSTSLALRSLKLKDIPGITRLTPDPVSQFRHLRVLEMTNFINVESFKGFDFLDSFPTLEDLSIVVKGRNYVCVDSPLPRATCLPSLECLRVSAPLKILFDFLQKIASVNLKELTFNYEPPPISEAITIIPKEKKKKTRVRSISDRLDLVEILSSRWPRSLKELVIVSPTNLTCGLRYLIRLQVLENLFIQGCSMDGIFDVFVSSSGLRNSLRSLCLTDAAIPLRLLKQIADHAPSLMTLSLSLDIQDTSFADEIDATNHPLQSLEIRHRDHAAVHQPYMNGDNFLQLVRMARYLNILFPNVQRLTASTRESEWEKVLQLVQLCQDSRRAEKSVKLVEDRK